MNTNQKEILKHDLKNPIIAQIRIIELFLNGNFGLLNFKQTEMMKLLLESNLELKKIINKNI